MHAVLRGFLVAMIGILLAGDALAQKKYDPGASDTEIKIGNVVPYSGPASAYGVIGKVEAAYFRMINEQGGINGRKINFISYDDAYSPPRKARRPIRQSRSTSTTRRYHTCLSRPAPQSGTIQRISLGLWGTVQPTGPKAPFSPNMS